VDVLLAEIQAGGPVDSGGAEYFDGQVVFHFHNLQNGNLIDTCIENEQVVLTKIVNFIIS
jgi:hypothetical protein